MVTIIDAIMIGNLSMVQHFIESGCYDKNYKSQPLGFNLLYIAYINQKFKIFKYLLNIGCNMNELCKQLSHNTYYSKIIRIALMHNDIDYVIELLKKGCDLDNILDLARLRCYDTKIYQMLLFAERAQKSDINFLKSEISKRNYIEIDVWVKYLSKKSSIQLHDWYMSLPNIFKCLLGCSLNNNKNIQYSRELVVSEGLIKNNIIKYLIPKYITELHQTLTKIIFN